MREPHDLAESARHAGGHAIASLVLDAGSIHRIVVLRELDAHGCGGFLEAKPNVYVKDRPDPTEFPEPPPSALEYGKLPEYRPAISKYLRKVAIELYAGVAAQDYNTGGDWFSNELLSASRTDRRILAGHHALFGWELDEDRIDGAHLRSARRLIDAFFGPLLVIEKMLLERLERGGDGELSGEEVREILKNAPRQRNPWRERELTKAELEALREEWRREAREYEATWRERNG